MKTTQLIIAILLFPLSLWYAVGVALRNIYYDRRDKCLLTGKRPSSASPSPVPTVGVGNLRMGGTGKTPHTEYLIRLLGNTVSPLSDTLLPLSLLSRGYGRKSKGFLLAGDGVTAADIGDEPLMMHRKFPDISVAVCEDRSEGLLKLSQLPKPPAIVLLDDVYQHRSVKPTVTILLTEYGDLYCNDHILPFGNLREFRSGSRRADIVVVTKCPPLLSPKKQARIRESLSLLPRQHLFFSSIEYGDPVPLFNSDSQFPLFDSQLLLVSGIAHPEPLKRHLERHSTVVHLNFPDHHSFSLFDCELIVNRYRSINTANKAIVTTEKDAMRFLDNTHSKLFEDIPFFYIPIKVKFFDQNNFDSTILDFFHNFANRQE